MRKKDLRYYWNAIILWWHAFRFGFIKENPHYISTLEELQNDYEASFKVPVAINDVNLDFYYTYSPLHSFKDSKPEDILGSAFRWENGIPVNVKEHAHFSPLIPFYYGMLCWNYYFETKKETYKDQIIKVAETMEGHGESEGESIVFEYDFDYLLFNLKKGWIAGITQALACSFYCRIYGLTGDRKYLELAKKVFIPMTKSIEDGGLLTSTKAGLEWVEEFPSDPSSYVFNGHIFAIIAAHDLYRYSKVEDYNFHYKSWIQSLVHHLTEYQVKHYILHNKWQNKLGNIDYQGLNVGQFMHLAVITKSELFFELYVYYNKMISWDDYYRFYNIKTKNDFKIKKQSDK